MLTGPEKAVLFLLSLDEEVARPIVNELSEDDLRKLRTVATTMRQVPTNAINETFKDFLERTRTAVAVPKGGLPYLRRLSADSLGEERARVVFDEAGAAVGPLARLQHAPPDAVSALLAKEPPQLVAAILARLEPDSAAHILAAMPIDRQSAVMSHVSRMTELPKNVLDDMAAALANELPSADEDSLVTVNGVAKAAEILNAAGRGASGPILEAIEAEHGDLANTVRQAMFTFEDLKRLDPRAMRELLREVPTEQLTTALKGVSEPVLVAIFAGLSSRAAELIKDDLEILGHIRKADIEKARVEIVAVALRLETEGRIDLGREEA